MAAKQIHDPEKDENICNIEGEDDNSCIVEDGAFMETQCEEQMEFHFDQDLAKEIEREESSQPKKQRKIDNMGRVRPSTYSKTSPKKVPQNTQATGADFSGDNCQPNIEVSDQDDSSNSTNQKSFHDIISEIMENQISTENDVEDDFSFEDLIPDDENETIAENEDDLLFTEQEDVESYTSNLIQNEATIYPGHSMSIHHSMVLILLYAICHSISGAQLADTLTLISLHCLHTHPGFKSIYMFKSYFADMQSPLKKHYFCKKCMTNIKEGDKVCPSENCGRMFSGAKNKDYFIEIPLEEQLKKIMQRPGILKAIQSRFSRKKKQVDGIEDIYDGKMYRKLFESGGPLSPENPYNISFSWNTDGIPVFKSSKFSLWPFYLIINELPYRQRMKKENMILCGLWFGESKPFMSLFTKPLMKSLKMLETNGIEYEVDNEQILTKAFLICGTADLPAKSLVLNCNQFNGQFSCLKCLHPGETYKTQKGGCVHTFSYNASLPMHEPRTSENCLRDAILATENRKTINGIKGPSFLMTLMSYDFVNSTSIDYMHGVLLGITKLLTKLWISTTHSKENFSISSYVEVIDQRLLMIKPPSIITRVPRTLSDHFKYWKASELRSWLFFYSLPILHDILPGAYLLHFACFVQGIFLLCTDSVSCKDIEKSQQLLSYFVHMFPSLYGERYVTLNMHSLLHLPQCVMDLGPLWVYSCFPFENINGTLMELFHGTQNVELQIMCGLNILQNMSNMIKDFDDERLLDFANKLHRKHSSIGPILGTSSASYPIGRSSIVVLTDDMFSKIMNECKFRPSKMLSYKRISLRGRVVHSLDYTRVQMRNSYTVTYYDLSDKEMHYGQIQYYILAKSCECFDDLCLCKSDLTAVINELKCTKQSVIESNFLNADVPHIQMARTTNNVHIVNVSKIMNVVVYLNFSEKLPDEKIFLCSFPNTIESD